ncbi:hypothetical protein D3C78_19520 [compost metagenome]
MCLEDVIKRYEAVEEDCCPGSQYIRYEIRNSAILAICGEYHVQRPLTKPILFDGVNACEGSIGIDKIGEVLSRLTEEELTNNWIGSEKFKQLATIFGDPTIIGGNKFSTFLQSDLLEDKASELLSKAYNARVTKDLITGAILSITVDPSEIALMGVDAEYSSHMNWVDSPKCKREQHNQSHKIWAMLEDTTVAVAILHDGQGKKVAQSIIRGFISESIHYYYFHKIYAISPYDRVMEETLKAIDLGPASKKVYLFDSNTSLSSKQILIPAVFNIKHWPMKICSVCEGEHSASEECYQCNGECVVSIECPDCDGSDEDCKCDDGYLKEECTVCNGEGVMCTCEDGVVEADGYNLPIVPYNDHEDAIIFDVDSIIFRLPT